MALNFENLRLDNTAFDSQFNDIMDDEEEVTTEQHEAPKAEAKVQQPRRPDREKIDYSLRVPTFVLDEEPPAKKKPRKKTTGKRGKPLKVKRDVTEADLDVMAFISQIKLASARQAAIATRAVTVRSVVNRLDRLKKIRLIGSSDAAGRKHVFYVTASGMRILAESGRIDPTRSVTVDAKKVSSATLGHTLCISQVVAQLYGGCTNLMNGSQIPEGEAADFVYSEYAIRAEYNDWLWQFREDHKQYKKNSLQESLAMSRAADGLFVVVSKHVNDSAGIGRFSHLPDLAIETPNGKRMAVEIELSSKNVRQYKDIMQCYADRPDAYSRITYVVQNKQIQNRVLPAAKAVGIERKIHFVPLLGYDLKPYKSNPWQII